MRYREWRARVTPNNGFGSWFLLWLRFWLWNRFRFRSRFPHRQMVWMYYIHRYWCWMWNRFWCGTWFWFVLELYCYYGATGEESKKLQVNNTRTLETVLLNRMTLSKDNCSQGWTLDKLGIAGIFHRLIHCCP